MVVLGGWACRWRELRPISIAAPQAAAGGGDVERGEGEEFEMVPMMGKEEGGGVDKRGGGSGEGGSAGGRV